MRGLKVRNTPTGEFFRISAVALLLLILVFGITYYFVQPAPPDTIVMTTGMEDRTYARWGERYKEILARSGVHLALRSSSGSLENFLRLKNRSLTFDVGFVQGGMSSSTEAPGLLSLGSISYNPLWVFYRGDETIDDFSHLKGKKIAIGTEGTGLKKFSVDLLKASRALDPSTVLVELTDETASTALKKGKIDVAITIGTEDNKFVRDLLHAPGVKLMSISQAEAYTRLFPALSHVVLPMGIANLEKRIPPVDIHLLSPTTNLVVRNTMHPALMYVLLDAAAEIHVGPSWVHKAGEFPAPKVQDFPLSDQAERFYKTGRPFLLDYLPFWAAVFLDRFIKIGIPVVVVLFSCLRIMPWLYSWRNRSKLHRWYGELRSLEREVSDRPQPERVGDYRAKLDWLEASVNRVHVSIAFYHEVYTLREHIEFVRSKVNQLVQIPFPAPEAAEPSGKASV